jgi:uncharacterized Zn finger protein
MGDELKPCPFCGSINVVLKDGASSILHPDVMCMNCGGIAPHYEWNHRASDPDLEAARAEIERLKAECTRLDENHREYLREWGEAVTVPRLRMLKKLEDGLDRLLEEVK